MAEGLGYKGGWEVATARCKGVEHQVCAWAVAKMEQPFPVGKV